MPARKKPDTEWLHFFKNGKAVKMPARLALSAPDLLEALKDLRAAATAAYKSGRIPAEPFVHSGNVIAKAEGR